MSNHNKVAIITGAGSGIGKSCALALIDNGYNVVLAGRRKVALENTIIEAAQNKNRLIAIPTDIGNESEVENLFAETKSRFGKLDLLFNNAGMGAPPLLLEDLTLENWQNVLDVNLTGTFLCT